MNNINAIWIQNETIDKMEYLFYGNELLNHKDFSKIEYVRKILFNNSAKKIIYKEDNYSQTTVSKFQNGFIYTGVLNSIDDLGRKLPFMIFVKKKNSSEIKEYIIKNLSSINKEIDIGLLELLVSKKDSSKKKIFFAGIIIIIITIIFKILTNGKN